MKLDDRQLSAEYDWEGGCLGQDLDTMAPLHGCYCTEMMSPAQDGTFYPRYFDFIFVQRDEW